MPGVAVPFELRVHVEPEDIDGQGHVNNVVYLRWAQEAATAHWEALAPPNEQLGIGWVARRHEIDYLAAAYLDDEITLRTWVGTVEGLSFERHTEILRGAERVVLARVRTIWIPIHPETGKPKRVSADVRRIFAIAARSLP